MSTARRSPRSVSRTGALTAGLACLALVTACGGDEGGTASGSSSSSSSPAAPSSSAEPTDDSGGLAAGLLPAEAFGPEATVTELTADQLRQGAGLAAGREGTEIAPESCASAVEGTQPQIDDYDEVAAVSATEGATTTIEVLLQGEATEGAVEQLAGAVTACPEARITSPDFGEATVTFESVDVPDLGDGSAAILFTTTVTQDGTEIRVPALTGFVEDGDRVVSLLIVTADGSAPDEATFTTLLEQAFQVQADALG